MLNPEGTVQWQARRIEELEARVHELESELADLRALPARSSWCVVFDLPPKQGQILDMMMQADDVASRIWIEDTLWPNANATVKALEVHISKVRQRLAERGFPRVIETHWGFGWRIRAEDKQRMRDYAASRRNQPQGRAR